MHYWKDGHSARWLSDSEEIAGEECRYCSLCQDWYQQDGFRWLGREYDYEPTAKHQWRAEFGANIGNVQGGWRETVKYKDKNGNWVTRTAWGSGKAGW